MTINAPNRTLPDWFTRTRTCQTVLPRFQRFESAAGSASGSGLHYCINDAVGTAQQRGGRAQNFARPDSIMQ